MSQDPLGTDILDYFPVEFALLLWLEGSAGYQTPISLRRVKPVFKLNELQGPRKH
jgi:hypothetical protein